MFYALVQSVYLVSKAAAAALILWAILNDEEV